MLHKKDVATQEKTQSHKKRRSYTRKTQLHKKDAATQERRLKNMSYQLSEKEHDFDQISICRSLGLLGLHLTGWMILVTIINPYGINEVVVLHYTLNTLSVLFLVFALGSLWAGIVNDESRHSRRLQVFFFGAMFVNFCILFASVMAYGDSRNRSNFPKFSSVGLVMIWILQLSVTFALWLGGGLGALHNEVRIIRLSFRWVISDAEHDLEDKTHPHGQHTFSHFWLLEHH